MLCYRGPSHWSLAEWLLGDTPWVPRGTTPWNGLIRGPTSSQKPPRECLDNHGKRGGAAEAIAVSSVVVSTCDVMPPGCLITLLATAVVTISRRDTRSATPESDLFFHFF